MTIKPESSFANNSQLSLPFMNKSYYTFPNSQRYRREIPVDQNAPHRAARWRYALLRFAIATRGQQVIVYGNQLGMHSNCTRACTIHS